MTSRRSRPGVDSPGVFREIACLATEALNPRTARLDEASIPGILKAINREDLLVAPAVARRLPEIAKAVEIVVAALKAGGRVFYVGAGTSGRLGVLDAAECPPTFGTPPELFQGIVAGGRGAVFRAREGAEDRRGEARRALGRKRVGPKDVVVGLAACSRTPFVVAALERARELGARTIYITCNPAMAGAGKAVADVLVSVDVGPEAIMGSTRMKSGTAEKMVLNMISTASMVRLGKVYGNLMVDLWATSEKLRHRSVRIVMLATRSSRAEALKLVKQAGGSVKVAVVMKLKGVGPVEARRLLAASDGFVRRAVERKPR